MAPEAIAPFNLPSRSSNSSNDDDGPCNNSNRSGDSSNQYSNRDDNQNESHSKMKSEMSRGTNQDDSNSGHYKMRLGMILTQYHPCMSYSTGDCRPSE
jgi:hypothetical protein